MNTKNSIDKYINSLNSVELQDIIKKSVLDYCFHNISYLNICLMYENGISPDEIRYALDHGAPFDSNIYSHIINNKFVDSNISLLQHLHVYANGTEKIGGFRIMQIKYFHRIHLFPHVFFRLYINEIYYIKKTQKTTLFLEFFNYGNNDLIMYLLNEGANPLLILPPKKYYFTDHTKNNKNDTKHTNRILEYFHICIQFIIIQTYNLIKNEHLLNNDNLIKNENIKYEHNNYDIKNNYDYIYNQLLQIPNIQYFSAPHLKYIIENYTNINIQNPIEYFTTDFLQHFTIN